MIFTDNTFTVITRLQYIIRLQMFYTRVSLLSIYLYTMRICFHNYTVFFLRLFNYLIVTRWKLIITYKTNFCRDTHNIRDENKFLWGNRIIRVVSNFLRQITLE